MFESIWDEESKVRALKLFSDVYFYLKNAGTNPSIIYGTLLGTCRDGKLIPWDGDFDLCIDLIHREKEPNFNNIRAMGYEIVSHDSNKYNYKVFRADGLKTERHFNWPWVDIDFYAHRENDIHFLNIDGSTFHKCQKDQMFPFEERKFEGMNVFTPKNPEWHLEQIYPNWENVYQSPKIEHKSTRKNEKIIEIKIEKESHD